MTTNKQLIINLIESSTDKEIDKLYELISLCRSASKSRIINFIDNKDILQNYDTAYPVDYIRNIEAIYPDITNGTFVYDYINNTFGELININNLFVDEVIKTLKNI